MKSYINHGESCQIKASGDVKSARESGHCCAFMLRNVKIQIAIFLDV
jgi:hypothetical protein